MTKTEYLALEGVALLTGTINEVRRLLNPRLGVDGVIMTMHAPTLLNTQVAGHLREALGDLVIEPAIRRNIRLAESPSQGMPIQFHAPQSHGGQDYAALATELAFGSLEDFAMSDDRRGLGRGLDDLMAQNEMDLPFLSAYGPASDAEEDISQLDSPRGNF